MRKQGSEPGASNLATITLDLLTLSAQQRAAQQRDIQQTQSGLVCPRYSLLPPEELLRRLDGPNFLTLILFLLLFWRERYDLSQIKRHLTASRANRKMLLLAVMLNIWPSSDVICFRLLPRKRVLPRGIFTESPDRNAKLARRLHNNPTA